MPLFTTSLLALLLAAPAAEKPARRDVLRLGKVELALGLSQEQATAKLEKLYVLEPITGTPSFFVREKATSGPGRSLGAVEFQEGRLASITRESWPKGKGRATDLAKVLADAVAELVKEGRTSCTLEADNAAPTMQVATIRCDKKHVSLAIVKTEAETKVVVTEMLR